MIKGKDKKFLNLKFNNLGKEVEKIIKIKEIKFWQKIKLRLEFKNYQKDRPKYKIFRLSNNQ